MSDEYEYKYTKVDLAIAFINGVAFAIGLFVVVQMFQ